MRDFIVSFLFLLVCLPARGQDLVYPSRFTLRSWTTVDGLSANYLGGFVLSDDGQLWITSFHGITRFDGSQFTTNSAINTPGWDDDSRVIYACKTEAGIWVHIQSRKNGLYLLKPGPEATLEKKGDDWLSVSCTDAGAVLAVSSSRLNADSLYNVYRGDRLMWSNALQKGESVLIDHSGQVWVVSEDRLYQDTESGRVLVTRDAVLKYGVHAIRRLGDVPYLVSDAGIFRIEENHLVRERPSQPIFLVSDTAWSPRDALWLSTPEALIRWTPAGESHYPVPNLGYRGTDNQKSNSYKIFHDDLFSITWVGGWEYRLLRYDALRGWHSMGLEREGVKAINGLVQDLEGSVWAATDQGLHQFVPRAVEVYGVDEGLADLFIYAVGKDAEGYPWVSTWTRGAQHLMDGRWQHLHTGNGLPDDHVSVFYVDPEGVFWIGAIGAVSRVEEGRVVQVYPLVDGHVQVPRSIYQDRHQRLWVGTINNLYRHNAFSGKFEALFPLAPSIQYNGFREDDAGMLWVATSRGWIYSADGKTWASDSVTAGIRISAFHLDSLGTMWMSTLGDGLIRQDGDRIFRYTAQHGLPSNSTHYVLEDRQGDLWVGTERGVLRIRRASLDAVMAGHVRRLDVLLLDENEGLPSGEMMVTANGAFQDTTGRLWLATSRGVVVIDPTAIEFGIPTIQIRRFELNETSYILSENMRFRPGPVNRITLVFSSQTLRPEHNVTYRSRLWGLEDQWKADPLHERHFTNLKPATYTFEVYATDHNGVRSKEPDRMMFTILPVWHQSWWFRGLLVFFVIAGVLQFLLRRERLRQVVFEGMRLRDRLAERERFSKDTHDSVLNNLVIRKKQLERLHNEESLSNAGTLLMEREIEAIDTLIATQQYHVWAIDPKNDRLDALGSRMGKYLRSVPAPIQVHLTMSPDEGLPEIPLDSERRNHVFLLFQETICNAVKHAACDRIEVSISYDAPWFRFMVQDNGKGYDPHSAHAGNGLGNMRYRAGAAGGEVDVSSRPGDGTMVAFQMTVGPFISH